MVFIQQHQGRNELSVRKGRTFVNENKENQEEQAMYRQGKNAILKEGVKRCDRVDNFPNSAPYRNNKA